MSDALTFMMPKIARKTLGLAEGAFSRIEIQGQSVVFTSDGVTKPVAFPVSMMGTFHSDILNNLFLYLRNNRQNGVLGVTTGPLTKVVFFKQGHIVFSGSTDATERIGNVLLRLGYMKPDQIAKVEANDDPRRFGVRCKDAGYISYEILWAALRAQVVGICCALIDFPVGSFFFLPNSVPHDSFNHFLIEPAEVLFKGVLRRDERMHEDNIVDNDPRSPLEILSAMEED